MSAKWNNVKSGTKSWVHSAAALSAGHVVYNVKYLGLVEVSAPKGADIVKEAVTKLKFNKQVKRSEGTKPPKMELTISVDGVTIQDRQTKEKQFTYPLHHISYCADHKSDKKICAFIAKDAKENKNICHVMESDKNAEEITLTVGQAFDLAYQKFLSNANKTQEQQQQNDTLRKRVSPSPSHSPRMGRMYSHGTFMPDSPPSRGATPPGIGTPPRAATPPTSRQGVSPRSARSPVISVTPLPSEEALLPPPPTAFVENQPPTLHPAPPTPLPPPTPPPPSSSSPQGAPLAPNSNPITTCNPTPDTPPTTISSPPDQSKPEQPKYASSKFEEDAHDHPNDPYRPNDVQSTKL